MESVWYVLQDTALPCLNFTKLKYCVIKIPNQVSAHIPERQSSVLKTPKKAIFTIVFHISRRVVSNNCPGNLRWHTANAKARAEPNWTIACVAKICCQN